MSFDPQTPPIATPSDDDAASTGDHELVTISRWELDALRARASGASAQPAIEAEEPIASGPMIAATIVPPDRGEEAKDRRTADLERAYREAVRDRELATALAGRPLVAGAAAQLIKLWRDEFDVFEEAGELRVVARDGRSLSKAISERLAQAEYAHFCPPPTRGGAATRGTGRIAGPDTIATPSTLGEAALQRWREGASARSGPTTGPIGLRRR